MADQKIGDHASSLSLGVTVIVLYAIFVSLVTFGFGSYIYRTGWQLEVSASGPADETAGQNIDIDNMLFILKREQNLEAERARLAGEISLLDDEVSVYNSSVSQSFATIARAKDEISLQFSLSLEDLTDFEYELPGPARNKYASILTNTGLDANLKLRALLDVVSLGFAEGGVDADTQDRFNLFRERKVTQFDVLLTNLKEANAASHDVQAKRANVQEQIVELQSARAVHATVIAGLKKKLPAASIARARLSALAIDLPFVPNILMQLVSFPTIFLTLIVTIAAGGLGTVVAFSRRYYSQTTSGDLTLSRLFVNVGEGIAAAIAIFLFSGAGMLALTQGGGADNSVELSPYTVAFVAFLSGFMAEDAFASIQAAGKRIFNTEEGTPKEQLKKAKALIAQDNEEKAEAAAKGAGA